MLKIFHWKIKNIKFLKDLGDIIQNYISVACRKDPRDFAIFLANLFHKALPAHGIRQASIGRFAQDSKHKKIMRVAIVIRYLSSNKPKVFRAILINWIFPKKIYN